MEEPKIKEVVKESGDKVPKSSSCCGSPSTVDKKIKEQASNKSCCS